MNENSPPSKTHKSWIGFFLSGAVAISIAAVLLSAIAAHTWKDVRKKPKTNNIRITGSAKKRILSDLIQWSATIEAGAPERYGRLRCTKEWNGKSRSFPESRGNQARRLTDSFREDHQEFETVLRTKCSRNKRGHALREKGIQGISSHSDRFREFLQWDLIEKASRKITELLEQGISVISSPPNYCSRSW